MHKIHKYIVPVLSFVAGAAHAQESGGSFSLDLSMAENAATEITTKVPQFFTQKVAPMILAIAGAAFAIYLIFLLFRWARRGGK